MDWLEVSIYTTPEGIDPLCGRLYNLGVTGLEIVDKDDFEDFLENNKQYWDYVDEELREKMNGETRVKIYLSDNETGHKMLSAVRDDLISFKSIDADGVFGSLRVEIDSCREEDWENNWKQYFKPIYVGDRLVIKPEWETIPDADGKIVFNIDPGMTFGSGQHETTRLCVETLDTTVKKGDKVLDLGCGSGILSIISLMLGAGEARAVDIDPNCKKIAYSNAALNGIGEDVYTVLDGNILIDEDFKRGTEKSGPYDIVVANIVADVIIPLASDVKRYLKDGGTFIASGIIEMRIDEVREAIEKNGFSIQEIKKENDWYCIISR